ncbi:MAG: hypothetical protein OEY11_09130 [Gammaproteobacteria bacterium]|nr:hypothetical protein [Gammaproteobacteria bacterium]
MAKSDDGQDDRYATVPGMAESDDVSIRGQKSLHAFSVLSISMLAVCCRHGIVRSGKI